MVILLLLLVLFNNMNVNKILLSYNQTSCCKHSMFPGRYNCIDINQIINTNLQSNILNKAHLTEYLHKLFTDLDSCWFKNYEDIKNTIINIFNTYPDLCSDELLIIMLKFPKYDICYENVKLTFKQLLIIANRLSTPYGDNYNDNTLAHIIIKNLNMDDINDQNIINFIKCNNLVISKFVGDFIDKRNLNYTNDHMDEACKNLPVSQYIISSLLSKNIPINKNHIMLCMQYYDDADMFNWIIDIFKSQGDIFIPNDYYPFLIQYTTLKDDFADVNTINEGDGHIKLNDNYHFHNKKQKPIYTKEKFLVLCKHGFVPSYEDVELSVIHKRELPNIEKYVKLDEVFLKLCESNNFHPSYNFACISKELYKLRQLCNQKYLKDIQVFLKSNPKIIPDEICMISACSIKQNTKILELLIKQGGVMTYECLKTYAKVHDDTQLNLIIKNIK